MLDVLPEATLETVRIQRLQQSGVHMVPLRRAVLEAHGFGANARHHLVVVDDPDELLEIVIRGVQLGGGVQVGGVHGTCQ